MKLAECAYDLPESLSAGTLASAISMASEPDQMRTVRGDWLSPIAKPASLTFETVRYFPQRGKWGAPKHVLPPQHQDGQPHLGLLNTIIPRKPMVRLLRTKKARLYPTNSSVSSSPTLALAQSHCL